jgi:hypothetical protein
MLFAQNILIQICSALSHNIQTRFGKCTTILQRRHHKCMQTKKKKNVGDLWVLQDPPPPLPTVLTMRKIDRGQCIHSKDFCFIRPISNSPINGRSHCSVNRRIRIRKNPHSFRLLKMALEFQFSQLTHHQKCFFKTLF